MMSDKIIRLDENVCVSEATSVHLTIIVGTAGEEDSVSIFNSLEIRIHRVIKNERILSDDGKKGQYWAVPVDNIGRNSKNPDSIFAGDTKDEVIESVLSWIDGKSIKEILGNTQGI